MLFLKKKLSHNQSEAHGAPEPNLIEEDIQEEADNVDIPEVENIHNSDEDLKNIVILKRLIFYIYIQ